MQAKDHQLWLDTLNLNIQAGKTLQEALLCADAIQKWPFKTVNGVQTPESVSLETMKQPKPLSGYAKVMADPDTEESPL